MIQITAHDTNNSTSYISFMLDGQIVSLVEVT